MRPLLVLVVALALAGTASAKGTVLKSATICGAYSCRTITGQDRVRELPTGGDTTEEAPEPAGYYLVEARFENGGFGDESRRLFYVPSRSMVAVYALKRDGLVWLPVSGSAIDAMMRGTNGVEPFQAPSAWPKDVPRVAAGPAAGFDWPLVSGSLLVALALGLTTLLLVRRSRQTPPKTA